MSVYLLSDQLGSDFWGAYGVFCSAVVLAAEADGGLVQGIHGRVHKPLNIASRRIARHDGGSEAVHRGLNRETPEGLSIT